MAKTKCNSKLYKLKLVDTSEQLNGEHNVSDDWNSLSEAILKDFRGEKFFEFVHPMDDGMVYSRHYIRPARYGYAALRVGQFRTGEDYAEVYINLESKKYTPYVVLLNPSPAFKNHQLLADIVARAFNWVLAGKKLRIEMETWEPTIEETMTWILDCIETSRNSEKGYDVDDLKDFGFEKLLKKGRKRKSDSFGKYIQKEHEEKVLSWLHSMIDDIRDIPNFMLPMRAVAELKLFIRRPPLEMFYKEFNKRGLVKKTAYHEYMNWRNDKCDDDKAYKEILRQAKEFFGISKSISQKITE